MVCERTFECFLKNYIESLPMKYFEEGDLWVVNDHEIGIRESKLSCACGHLEKTGIPCSHSIKLIVDLKEDCLNYIHKRWHLKIG